MLTIGHRAGFDEVIKDLRDLMDCDLTKLTAAFAVAFLMGWHARGAVVDSSKAEDSMKIEALVRSVRYAFRALRRAPGFTHYRPQKS